MADDEILKRLRRLEDQEGIRAVIARYADAVDHDAEPALLRGCFTADAVWRGKGIGVFRGRAAIVKGIRATMTERITWALHYMTQPVIKVAADGKTAKAHYYLWELAKFRPDGAAETESTWIGGWYDSRFRKVKDDWRFSSIKLTIRLLSPHRLPEWRTLD
jgi:limonene-1,2-epoxide hydrolase